MRLHLIVSLVAMLPVFSVSAFAQEAPLVDPHEGRCGHEVTIYRPDLTANLAAPEGAGFTILATFMPNITNAQQAVIQQAINEWQAIIMNGGNLPNPYPITFTNGPLATFIGLHSKIVGGNGTPISSVITFDNDGTTAWFVDASPADDAEFAAGVTPPAGSDYLSVARHEIGHAMGWTSTPVIVGLIAGTTFDSATWNIQMEPGGTMHADPATFPGDLMVPAIPAGVRRSTTLYPDATLGARHYGRDVVMKYIDPRAGPAGIGTASEPWNSVANAFLLAPPGAPLLMTPELYGGPISGYTLSTPHTLDVANGGAGVLDTL